MSSRKNLFLSLLLILAGICLVSCSGTSVQRVDPNEEIALTDKWNATDSRLVSEEMITDMLSFPWITRWRATNPRNPQPTVIVLGIRNRSHEHISVDTFVNDLKRAMIRSGAVDFVASGELRDDIRAERLDQEFNATPETAAAIARETGANFALSGSIDSFVDQKDGSRVTSYQVDLRLTDMSSNREVWSGQKKIQKLQKRSGFRF